MKRTNSVVLRGRSDAVFRVHDRKRPAIVLFVAAIIAVGCDSSNHQVQETDELTFDQLAEIANSETLASEDE